VQYPSYLYPLVTDHIDPCKSDRFRQDSIPRISVRPRDTVTGTPHSTQNPELYKRCPSDPKWLVASWPIKCEKSAKIVTFWQGVKGGRPHVVPFARTFFSDAAVGQRDGVQTIWIDLRKKLSKKIFFCPPTLGVPPAPTYPTEFCFLFRCVRSAKLCLLPKFGINATILEYFTEFWWFFTFYLIK